MSALYPGWRALLAFACVAIALAPNGAARPAAAVGAPQGRVIVLGFDGADARTVEQMMNQGELPNLRALRDQGTFAPLGTTMPAESPVSWASLNSGQNPAKTGIPGFVKRDFSRSGDPVPGLGHQVHGARPIESFSLRAPLSFFVGRSAATAAAVAGAIVLCLFLLVFRLLLRLKSGVAVVLSLVLAAAGAVGGHALHALLPREIPVVQNPTRTAGFWEVAAKAGVPCVVLDAAMAWDRPEVENLRLLAGLGIPDVRSANGDWFIYTTESTEFAHAPDGRATSTAGKVFRVDERDGKIESRIFGPRNFWAIERLKDEAKAIQVKLDGMDRGASAAAKLSERLRVIQQDELPTLEGSGGEDGRLSVPLLVEKLDSGIVRVSIQGHAQDLRAGAWSEWYRVSFEVNALIQVHAVTRVKVIQAGDPFELYVDFLQIDPSSPPFWQPISAPESFAADLAKAIDTTYETVGWACMTMPFKDREIDPATFLEDIEFTAGWREKILMAALQRDDWRMLMNVESTPDRVQHMMYQFYDQGHPLYDAVKAAAKVRYFGEEIALSEVIPATYRQLDRLVGRVMKEHLRAGDTLILCADHGFQTFRRGVNLNNWLAENGYLVLKDGISTAQNNILEFMDPARSRAYAVGLGMIFLNLAGREGDGIVDPADAPALLDEIQAKLLATVDPDTGERVVRKVYRMAEIHSGPYLDLEADLMPGFEAHYRVSWRTTLGGISLVKGEQNRGARLGAVFEDNKNNWSGDHVSVADDLVQGIFFSNRKVELPSSGASLLHIAPTCLDALGVAVPAEYDLPALRFTTAP